VNGMRTPLWVVAVVGVACSGGSTTPDAQPAVPSDGGPTADAAVAPDATAGMADTAASPDEGQAAADASVAADGPDQVTVEAGTPAMLAVDMSAFIFGPTPFSCESMTPAVLTVSNAGGATSSVVEVVLEGAFPDRFRVEKDGCGGRALASGATCVVQVRFAPKMLMDQPATAQLVVKGAAGERAATSLSGESNVDNFDVFPLMAGFLDFQTVKVASASATQEDVWTNHTDFPAIPRAPVLMGLNAADFAVVSDTCTGKSIPARQSCRLGVQMKPTAAGQRFATINVTAAGACGYDFADVLTLIGVGE
jgi:hypothetical protein